jgi:uncharacterized membrane protein
MLNTIKKIKVLFLGGLFTLLPLGITLYIIQLLFSLIFFWLAPLRKILPATFLAIPLAELWIALAVIFIVGFISHIFVLKRIVHWIEDQFLKIPFIKPLYSGVKQLLDVVANTGKKGEQAVVLVQFPHKESYTLGFVTGKIPEQLSPTSTEEYFSVFVPTTPNPTAGFLLLLQEKQMIRTTLSKQEALGMIISGGIVKPQKINEQS